MALQNFAENFTKILNKIQPKLILEVVSYSLNRMVLNRLAFERSIPVVELQHGTMGREHIAYNYKEKKQLPELPDYYWIFGQFWKKNTRLPCPQKMSLQRDRRIMKTKYTMRGLKKIIQIALYTFHREQSGLNCPGRRLPLRKNSRARTGKSFLNCIQENSDAGKVDIRN